MKLAKLREEMFGPLKIKGHWPLMQPDIKWYRIRFIVTRQAKAEGIRLPSRFGFSYKNFNINADYYYLIPLNLIVAIFKHIHFMFAWKITYKLKMKQNNSKCYYIVGELVYGEVHTLHLSTKPDYHNQGEHEIVTVIRTVHP